MRINKDTHTHTRLVWWIQLNKPEVKATPVFVGAITHSPVADDRKTVVTASSLVAATYGLAGYASQVLTVRKPCAVFERQRIRQFWFWALLFLGCGVFNSRVGRWRNAALLSGLDFTRWSVNSWRITGGSCRPAGRTGIGTVSWTIWRVRKKKRLVIIINRITWRGPPSGRQGPLSQSPSEPVPPSTDKTPRNPLCSKQILK